MFNQLPRIANVKERLGKRQLFYLFCFALGFIGLTDSILGYYFPIAAEGVLGSNFAVGLMIGLSNLAALTCDFLFPELLRKKTWKFFLLGAVFLQIALPAFTFLGVFTSFGTLFLVADLFWNVYYEMMAFSRHNFIINNEKPENFARDWGMISVTMGFMAIIGPIIGSQIAESPLMQGVATVAVIQSVAILACIAVVAISPNNHVTNFTLKHRVQVKLSVLREMKLWEVLGARVLPILILGSINTMIAAAVYTVGGLLGEQILGEMNLDWMLIFVFSVPGIFSSLFLTRFVFKRYKKLLAQVTLILAAIPLVGLPIFQSQPWIVILIFFICSFFSSMSWVFNEAVFSDMSRRAKENGLYVNAIERVNESFGYLLGPIIIGFLADTTDYFWGFAFIGLFAILIALILIVVTPRKLKLPQQELQRIEFAS